MKDPRRRERLAAQDALTITDSLVGGSRLSGTTSLRVVRVKREERLRLETDHPAV
jgi:hypothetical protein